MWSEMTKELQSAVSQLANLGKAEVSPATSNNKNQIRLKRLARENREVTTLYNIGIAIGSNLTLNQVLWTLYKECGRLIDTTNFALVLYDDYTNTLNFSLVFDQGRGVEPFSVKLVHSQGLASRVLLSQAPLLIQDLSQTSYLDETQRLHPDQPIRSWLGVPILNPRLIDESAQGVIVTWSHKPDAFGDYEQWLLSMIGTQAAIAIRNAYLFEASQRRALEMAVINDVVQTLSATLQLDQVLSRMMEQVEGLLNVERGFLFLKDPVTGDLVFQIALGNKVDQVKPFRLPKRRGLAAQVAQTGKPLQITNIDRNTRNALAVPLLLHGQVIGVLEVINRKEGNFTRSDIELLSSVASYAAIAIENARLHESVLAERDRVIEAEEQARKELAHDLHDGPTQVISAVMMRLEFCLMLLEREPARLAKEIIATKALAAQAVHEIRTLLFELRPLALEMEGLETALRIFLERRQQDMLGRTRLALKVKTPHPDGTISRQDNKVEAALFAIVQEAVNNAIKHAQANKITVHLKETSTALYVIIIDNGEGFDVDEVLNNYEQRGSLGMLNIRERTELIGGELTMKSTLGQGTCISVYVPKAKEMRMEKRATTGLLSLPFNLTGKDQQYLVKS